MKVKLNVRVTLMPVIILFLLTGLHASGQELQKGDKVPKAIKSYLGPADKPLLILHFWNTRCGGCIRALPRIDSLQAKFQDRVKFILVSTEKSDVINDLFAVRKNIKRPRGVQYITGDTLLRKHFPYTTVPHSVWLSAEGTVVTITTETETNELSIQRYLRTGISEVAVKREYGKFDWSLPVVTNYFDAADSKDKYYSYLLPAIDTVRDNFERKKANGSNAINRILIHKSSIAGLYLIAYNDTTTQFSMQYGNVKLELKDRNRYIQPDDLALRESWNRNHLYLYDLQVPEAKAAKLYSYMRADLERVFDLKVSVEQVKRKCLVLKLVNRDALVSKGGVTGNFPPKANGDSTWRFRNYIFEGFKWVVGGYIKRSGYEFKDETGFQGKIDIDIDGGLMDKLDIVTLRKDLKKFGLLLEEQECIAPILVISD